MIHIYVVVHFIGIWQWDDLIQCLLKSVKANLDIVRSSIPTSTSLPTSKLLGLEKVKANILHDLPDLCAITGTNEADAVFRMDENASPHD